jgi:GT2 family glycosyltransferase
MVSDVTVVVPVHREGDQLQQLHDSLKAQEYKAARIVLVLNGSDRHTHRVAEALCADPHTDIHVVSRASRGLARRQGMMAANTQFVAMVDADCVVPQYWISSLRKSIRQSRSDVVYGSSETLVRTRLESLEQENVALFWNTHKKNVFDTKNAIMNRQSIMSIGSFDTSMRSCEDVEISIRAIAAGLTITYAPQITVAHHHDTTFLRTFARNMERGYWNSRVAKRHPDAPADLLDRPTLALVRYHLLEARRTHWTLLLLRIPYIVGVVLGWVVPMRKS